MSDRQPKNVLFLIADDWSPLARCYGNDVIQTPNIDRFAERGTIFDYGFCTSPSCAVSRACILTGHYSHTHGQYGHCHGIHGFRTHEIMATLPRILQDHNVASAAVGKRHVAPEWLYPFEEQYEPDMRSVHDMADCARDFLAKNRDRPFYLHVGFADPHRSAGGFGNEHTYRDVKEVTYDPDEIVVPPFLPDTPAVRAELADYYQAVSRFDTGIGLMLEALEESGRVDETLVFVTTDHAMPWPGAKASSFDSGHRCPLIVYSPAQQTHGKHCQALVNWQDFMPTFLDWLGVEGPEELPGRSLLPILDEAEPEGWDETWYSHNFHEVTNYYPYRVLRRRKYKYVLNLAHQLPMPLPSDLFRSKTWQEVLATGAQTIGERTLDGLLYHDHEQLFDMETDPCETRNLIDQPELQEMVGEMRATMTKWRQRTADPWLELSFQHGDVEDDAYGWIEKRYLDRPKLTP